MKKLIPFWLVLLVCAAALVASGILLVDYVRPAPVFCGNDGCGAMKRTVFAYPLGVPMPILGMGGFLAIGLAQLLSGRRARIAQAMLAAFGAIVAAGLLVVQLSLRSFCPFCVVADGAALILFGLSVARALRGWDPPLLKAHVFGGVAALVVAAAAPVALGMMKKPIPVGVPAVIAEEMKKTPRGRVTVVDFVDFECPFCRATHAELAPLLAERKDKVRVVRKHVPLRMHPHAMDAARAACCGETLGKGDEMAELLFATEPSALTPEGCDSLASKLGLDAKRFRDCMNDPATAERIRQDKEAFKAAQGHGLPTLFIDGVKLEGAQERAVLVATLDDAIRAL